MSRDFTFAGGHFLPLFFSAAGYKKGRRVMRLPFQPNRWLKKTRYGSGLAVAAQNVDELVPDQLLDGSTGRLEILAGVELVGVLIEELTDGASHG